jgi:hypothetical protein
MKLSGTEFSQTECPASAPSGKRSLSFKFGNGISTRSIYKGNQVWRDFGETLDAFWR